MKEMPMWLLEPYLNLNHYCIKNKIRSLKNKFAAPAVFVSTVPAYVYYTVERPISRLPRVAERADPPVVPARLDHTRKLGLPPLHDLARHCVEPLVDDSMRCT